MRPLIASLCLTLSMLMLGGCGSAREQEARQADTSVKVHAFKGPSNNWDLWQKRDKAVFVAGVIQQRDMKLSRDDSNRPPDSSFERGQLSAEEYSAFIRAADETPAMYWQVTVVTRDRGPNADMAENVIHLKRVASEDEWAEYQESGRFPEAYAELEEGRSFRFALLRDAYRTRGPNKDRHAFYTLLGWAASRN